MHIVITGGSRGIGFGLMREFIKRKHKVTFTATSDKTLNNAVKEINSQDALGVICDVRNLNDLNKLKRKAVEKFGNIDLWINNAGIDQSRNLFKDIDAENYKKVIDVNVIGLMNGSTIALKQFEKQGYGHLYNMEGYGSDGMKMDMMSVYGTSKRAVRYFTKSLAKEMKDTGIKVSRLSPGMVRTDFLLKDLEEKSKGIVYALSDEVDVVCEYLVEKMLINNKNDSLIAWMSKTKASMRMMKYFIFQRN